MQAELLQAERRLQAEQEASQEMQRQLNRTRSQDQGLAMPRDAGLGWLGKCPRVIKSEHQPTLGEVHGM